MALMHELAKCAASSLATNAKRVCAAIMLKQLPEEMHVARHHRADIQGEIDIGQRPHVQVRDRRADLGLLLSVLYAALLDVTEPELAAPDDGAVLCVVCADVPAAGDCCGCDAVCCLSAAPDDVDGAVEFDWDCGDCSDFLVVLGDCAKAAFASTSPKALVANRRIMVHSLSSKRPLATNLR